MLTHLCDGLEKFLGFNSATKGYDGQGIVYSDLDRLCDGVMAFLYQVLKDVKENDNLSPHKNTLETAVNTLNENLNNGKKGLEAVIDPVKQGIAGWLGEVNARSEAVKNPINILEISLSGLLETIKTRKDSEYGNDVLNDWLLGVGDLSAVIDGSFKNLFFLDDDLNNLLKPYVNVINNGFLIFRQNALRDHGDLREVCRNVDKQFDSVRNNVYTETKSAILELKNKVIAYIDHIYSEFVRNADHQRDKCIEELKSTFYDTIYMPIDFIKFNLQSVVRDLEKWLEEAGISLGPALLKADNIYQRLDPTGGNKSLKNKIADIELNRTHITNVHQELNRIAASLETWITQAGNLVDTALSNVVNVISEVNSSQYISITKAIGNLGEHVKNHFIKFKKEELKDYAHHATQNLEELANSVEDLVDDCLKESHRIYAIWVTDRTNVSNQRILLDSIQSLTNVSEPVMQAANDLSKRYGIRIMTNDYLQQSGPSLGSSLGDLQRQLQKVQRTFPTGRQLNFASITNDQIASHFTYLTNLATATRNVIRDAVKALKERIARGVQASTKVDIDVSYSTSIMPLHESLQKAESLAQQLNGLPARPGSDVNSNLNIQRAYENIKQLSISVSSFTRDFNIQKTEFEKFSGEATQQFGSLFRAVELAAERGRNDLSIHLKNKYFKQYDTNHPVDDTESVNKIKHDLNSKIGTILSPTSAITKALQEIKAEVADVRERLKTDVISKLKDTLGTGIFGDNKWKGTASLKKIKEYIIKIIGTDPKSNDANNLTKILDNCSTFHTSTIGQPIAACITEIKSVLHYNVTELKDRVINSASNNCEDRIKLLLYTKVAEAKKQIKNNAYEKFVSTKHEELNKLKDVVEREKQKIDELIRKNLKSGLKGMMSKMKANVGMLAEIEKLVSNPPPPPPGKDDGTKLRQMSGHLKTYYQAIHDHINGQVTDKTKQLPTDQTTEQTSKLTKIKSNFDNLLGHLHTHESTRKYIYDNDFTKKLASLQNAVHELSPSHFANPRHPELLDAVRQGLRGFVTEMERVYVNGYDGSRFVEMLTHGDGKNMKLTDYGRKCSKAFFTLLSVLYSECATLKNYSGITWRTDRINEDTPVGYFLKKNGYIVATKDKQDGELQDRPGMVGFHIYNNLVKNDEKHVYNTNDPKKYEGPLEKLHNGLQTYYQVGHVTSASAKKRPSNIFEILCWLSGLPSNNVYEDVIHGAVSDLFVDPAKQITVGELSAAVVGDEPVPAYPHSIELERTQAAVRRLCSKSYDVLIRVLGYGDAYTMYAVDIGNNALNFHYPPKAGDCLQMLIDMLRRLLPPLRFLHSQCKLSAEFHGWSECFYGRDIKTTKWTCTEHSRSESACQANCQPTCEPKCQVTCKPSCQPMSPLMSYLNDCSPGHLPHSITDIGCNPKCTTCPKGQPGQSCLTPLGFRGFSGSTKTGKNLCDILDEFFDNEHLLSLFTLSPRPPATLAEYFCFAMRHFGDWQLNKPVETHGIQSSFEASLKKLSINQLEDDVQSRSAFRDIYGSKTSNQRTSSVHPDDRHADILSLCLPRDTTICSVPNDCAPYLYNLYCDSYHFLAEKNSDLHLSWAVYLPWSLWYNLESLLNEFCNIICQDWGCRRCLTGDRCKKGKHGDQYSCHCSSVVTCKGVSPILYKYGFTFSNAAELHAHKTRKKCYDFAQQLKHVISSEYFTNLFRKCDDILWTIRTPFTYLVLTLWLLSFLYLIHIMVIRLDLLHIKSHLHSPSSHRIAAQSLLAAGRVNKLNRVFYLQP